VAQNLKPNQRVFVGVIDVCSEAVESAETVRDRALLAAEHIPIDQLGTTDDCGDSPFANGGRRRFVRNSVFVSLESLSSRG